MDTDALCELQFQVEQLTKQNETLSLIKDGLSAVKGDAQTQSRRDPYLKGLPEVKRTGACISRQELDNLRLLLQISFQALICLGRRQRELAVCEFKFHRWKAKYLLLSWTKVARGYRRRRSIQSVFQRTKQKALQRRVWNEWGREAGSSHNDMNVRGEGGSQHNKRMARKVLRQWLQHQTILCFEQKFFSSSVRWINELGTALPFTFLSPAFKMHTF